MKILHISTYNYGGAGIAAYRFHLSLLKFGYNSKFLCLNKNNHVNQVYQIKKKYPSLVQRLLSKVGIETLSSKKFNKKVPLHSPDYEVFSFPFSDYDIAKNDLYLEADIIVLHWAVGLIDLPLFFKKNRKRLYVYLHDLNYVLGGFHYPFDEVSCVDPVVLKYNKKIKAIKKEIYKKSNFEVLCNSNWSKVQLENSSLLGEHINRHMLQYGLDTMLFKPINKIFAKDFFHIPKDSKVICFGAQSISNKRKGFNFLLEALKLLDNPNIHLLIFGDDIEFYNINFATTFTGFINNDFFQKLVYSAADVFVIPSVEEAFGQTLIEAMACGTASIGFNTGGIKDIIEDSVSGFLIEPYSVLDLANKIKILVDDEVLRHQFEINSVKRINEKFTEGIQIRNFINILKTN
jgi:glycosyltransferase involved in cell wall biosynthesis